MRMLTRSALAVTLALGAGAAPAPAAAAEAGVTSASSGSTIVTAEDIAALRRMIEQQQQQIEQLRREMQQRNGPSTEEGRTPVGAVEREADRFRWSGDVRLRNEGFWQNDVPSRYRPRLRLRFGVEAKLSEGFSGGITVASGNLNDPTSTNSSLGDAFQRKPVSLDRGFVAYNPAGAKWLFLTGGKFPFTWARTGQTFDSDINPEGFSEKLSFDLAGPLVRNVSLTGLQLILNETNNLKNSATPLPAGFPTSSRDSWAYGAQVGVKLQVGKMWTVSPSYTILEFQNPDALVNGYASLVAGGQTIDGSKLQTPGVSTTGFAPNGMTNSICLDVIGATPVPVFCSRFLTSDAIVNATLQTASPRLPVNLLVEYEDNLRAQTSRSHLYQVEVSVGRTKNKADFQLGYAFTRAEQDAVIASFAESDQRFPTNVLQHRLFGSVKIAPNTLVSYTQWIGRALDTSLPNTVAFGFSGGVPYGFTLATTTPGAHEPWLYRGQLDLVHTF